MKPEHCLFCLGSSTRALRLALNWYVICPGCGARGPVSATKDKAITDWNRPPLGMGRQREIESTSVSATEKL